MVLLSRDVHPAKVLGGQVHLLDLRARYLTALLLKGVLL
tara:strand:+ start:446 stop:562 length:117 start_codon:yes stop_codon:yes gene_type:complete